MGPPPITTEQNTTIYSADNEIIGVEKGIENRDWIELENMSEKVIHTTILLEDQHFYDHYGFDLKRIAGAVLKNIQSASLREGASTITQQLARNLYLTHEKTWTRKLKEAFYAIRLEMHYSKDDILEGYLNTIYYGHGAYGIEAASNYFFDKSQEDLTYAEVAMLAGIPKGPTYYSPLNNEANANARKDMILGVLRNGDVLSDAEYQKAKQEELTYAANHPEEKKEIAPYYQDIVMREAAERLDMTEEAIRSGGYQIYSTLQLPLQKQVDAVVQKTIPEASELEAAVLSIDPHSGAVLALAGGRDYEKSMFNRAVSARRMPGSSFKPFLYYAALENGYTALTEQMSTPTEFVLEDGKVYNPSNFNHYYADKPITLAQAIALSDNVYAVRTNLYLGTETLVETAEKFGFSSDLPAVPSLALGTAAVTLEEMVAGYGMLANGGREVEPYTIEKITDRNENTVYEKEVEQKKPVLDEKKAFILTHLLTGIFDSKLNGYMPVTGSSISDQLSRIYAGKSGTTASDNWMVGYSPSMVTGVWTGYDDNRNIEIIAETTYAKEIWADVMEAAHAGKPQENFPAPKGVVGIPIDVETGLRATPNCSQNVMMYFEQGTEPREYCDKHQHPDADDGKGIFRKWFDLFF